VYTKINSGFTTLYGHISHAPTASDSYMYKFIELKVIKWAVKLNHMAEPRSFDVSPNDDFLIWGDYSTTYSSYVKLDSADGTVLVDKKFTEIK
jgi:hypothetical protein